MNDSEVIGQLYKIAGPGKPQVPLSADGRVESCSFLTTGPNELMEPIHNRMPVIVPSQQWATWLNPDVEDVDVLKELLLPYPAEEMQAWPVSTHVNKPANNDPECIRPLPKLKIIRPGTSEDNDEPAAQPGLFD